MPALDDSVTYCECCSIIMAKAVAMICESIHHGARSTGDTCLRCIYPIETPDGIKQFCKECKERERM